MNRRHSPSGPRHSQRFLSGFFLLIKHSYPNTNQSPPPRAKGSPGRAWYDRKQTTPGLRGKFLHVRKKKKKMLSLIASFSVYLSILLFPEGGSWFSPPLFFFFLLYLGCFYLLFFIIIIDSLHVAKACFIPLKWLRAPRALPRCLFIKDPIYIILFFF